MKPMLYLPAISDRSRRMQLEVLDLRLSPIEYEKLNPNANDPVLPEELINLIPLLIMLCKESTQEYSA